VKPLAGPLPPSSFNAKNPPADIGEKQ